MLISASGNILHAQADALVNPVNCAGVMGKGLALQFKRAFPDMFQAYRRAAKNGEVVLGRIHIFSVSRHGRPRYIFNFPTKRHWRSRSRIEDIERGLWDMVDQIRQLGVSSIAIPPLGCGHGGLHWPAVRQLVVQAFASSPEVRVLLFEPQ